MRCLAVCARLAFACRCDRITRFVSASIFDRAFSRLRVRSVRSQLTKRRATDHLEVFDGIRLSVDGAANDCDRSARVERRKAAYSLE